MDFKMISLNTGVRIKKFNTLQCQGHFYDFRKNNFVKIVSNHFFSQILIVKIYKLV